MKATNLTPAQSFSAVGSTNEYILLSIDSYAILIYKLGCFKDIVGLINLGEFNFKMCVDEKGNTVTIATNSRETVTQIFKIKKH
jgi:hypothetical protein